MNKLSSLIISLLLVFFLGKLAVFPCTGFTYLVGSRVLIGNNEDYNRNFTDTVVRIRPASQGKYGCLLVGFNRQNFSMGGMNDQGLFYDWFSVPANDWEATPDKPYYNGGFRPEDMLEQCANVDEAVAFFQKYNLDIFRENQVFVVDKTGKSAVISWGEGGLDVVYKEGAFQVVTNFYLLHPERGWFPCRRYDTAKGMLENAGEISIELFRAILDAVHAESSSSCTQYSNIYELQKGDIYLFNHYNFDEFIKLNLGKELDKGSYNYQLPGYFSEIKLISPAAGDTADPTNTRFLWQGKSSSRYRLYCSTDPDFKDCVPYEALPGRSVLQQRVWFLFCCGFLFLGTAFFNRKRRLVKCLIFLLLVLPLVSCKKAVDEPIDPGNGIKEMSLVVDNLLPNSIYYWKLTADTGGELTSESIVKIFKTGE